MACQRGCYRGASERLAGGPLLQQALRMAARRVGGGRLPALEPLLHPRNPPEAPWMYTELRPRLSSSSLTSSAMLPTVCTNRGRALQRYCWEGESVAAVCPARFSGTKILRVAGKHSSNGAGTAPQRRHLRRVERAATVARAVYGQHAQAKVLRVVI